MRDASLETGFVVVVDVVVDFGTDTVAAAVLVLKVDIPRDWQVRWGHSMAAAQRRDSQGCRRGWNRQRSAAAGMSGDCMFGFAAADCVAVTSLGAAVVGGSVVVGAVAVAQAAAAETAAVQSVDAVGGDHEAAAAIVIRAAVAVEEKLSMAVAAVDVAVAVAEEEEDQEEAGNTARLELGSASRN